MPPLTEEEILSLIRQFIDPIARIDDESLVIHQWEGKKLERPITVHLTVAELSERLTIDEESWQALWPERSQKEAGLFLFIANINDVMVSQEEKLPSTHIAKDAAGILRLVAGPVEIAKTENRTLGDDHYHAHASKSRRIFSRNTVGTESVGRMGAGEALDALQAWLLVEDAFERDGLPDEVLHYMQIHIGKIFGPQAEPIARDFLHERLKPGEKLSDLARDRSRVIELLAVIEDRQR